MFFFQDEKYPFWFPSFHSDRQWDPIPHLKYVSGHLNSDGTNLPWYWLLLTLVLASHLLLTFFIYFLSVMDSEYSVMLGNRDA